MRGANDEGLRSDNLRESLKKLEGYDEVKRENLDELHYQVRCKLAGEDGYKRNTLLFIDSGIVLLDHSVVPGSLQFISYSDISECRLYDHKEGINLRVVLKSTRRSLVCILKSKKMAQKALMLVKIGREGIDKKPRQDSDKPIPEGLGSIVRFGNLRFLISYSESEGLGAFKKKSIHRLGRHFYPTREVPENSIDLAEYSELLFHVHHDGMSILLENDADFSAAINFFGRKLDVSITVRKSRRSTGSSIAGLSVDTRRDAE